VHSHNVLFWCVCGKYNTGLSAVCPFVLLKSTLPADLLPLVFSTLIFGYTDRDHNLCTAETKFAMAITSIIPLSYYIGMGIARYGVFCCLASR